MSLVVVGWESIFRRLGLFKACNEQICCDITTVVTALRVMHNM